MRLFYNNNRNIHAQCMMFSENKDSLNYTSFSPKFLTVYLSDYIENLRKLLIYSLTDEPRVKLSRLHRGCFCLLYLFRTPSSAEHFCTSVTFLVLINQVILRFRCSYILRRGCCFRTDSTEKSCGLTR